MLKVKVINKSNNELPKYETSGSAGLDLRANLTDNVVIPVGKHLLVPTGLFIQLPYGYEAQVRPRSGLAAKFGITVLNSPGTIDADYRGEIAVNLINLGDKDFEISNGDRIAQMVINKIEQISFESVLFLDETERGAGGHGSTGRK
jgi:dUTP pyrophosphatase|nr:MAG TPA: dUTPase [Caudoviricetes sp.]